jgi:hypothetical protein
MVRLNGAEVHRVFHLNLANDVAFLSSVLAWRLTAPRGFDVFAVACGHAMDSRCAAAPLRKNDKYPVTFAGFSTFAVACGHAMDSRSAAAPLRKNDKRQASSSVILGRAHILWSCLAERSEAEKPANWAQPNFAYANSGRHRRP